MQIVEAPSIATVNQGTAGLLYILFCFRESTGIWHLSVGELEAFRRTVACSYKICGFADLPGAAPGAFSRT